jgi:hypothetical protein
MGERLMVHPASVTNAITRLEQRPGRTATVPR